MSKRAIDETEDRATKQVRTTLEQPAKTKADDEGMGEFEDQWGDEEESDGEVIEHDAEAEEENGDEDMEMIGAIEDEDREAQAAQPEKEPYIPGVSRALTAEEILEPDYSVYLALHQLSYTWPCLSFDVLRDDLGWERNKFPHTAWVVAGTQSGRDSSSDGMGKIKDEVVVMKWGGLSRTRAEESDEEEDDEDVDDYDEDAHLEYLSIPHSGGVNRIRAQKQLPSTGLPPAGTPYHVATMAETGKVHIFDVRPMIDQLASPSTALPRTDKSKRPLHTITNHGRNEGFALDWSPASSSTSDLRLLSGDIASQIYHTSLTPTGFITQPKPFLSHTSSIEDLQWSPSESTVFASCSADRSVRVWDVRVKNRKSVTGITEAHDEDVNVISWNTGVEYLLCSGGDEGGIKVWDLRNMKGGMTQPAPVAHFTWHQKPITSIEWHPTDTSVLAASSADDSVSIWDLSVEADEEEAATKKLNETNGGIVVPPQLLFVHQGQKHIKELHWHAQIPGMVSTTAADGFNVFKTISA